MIVYYDPLNGNILGLSHKRIPNKTDSHFETDNPIAEKIFLGQEKAIKYIAVVRPGAGQEGFIKLRQPSATAIQTIKDRVIEFPKHGDSAELTIIQDCNLKVVSVKILESSHRWWASDNHYSLKKLIIVACKENDPYVPLWSCEFTPNELNNLTVEIPYKGTDNISFYTTRLFDSYKHEIKSSGN